jgi:two-component system, OmpR family, phosphate regulon sensor histidine kinase PhoR
VLPRRLATRILASHLLTALAAVALVAFLVGGAASRLVAVATILLGLAAGMALALSRSLTIPIARLARSVRHIASSDQDAGKAAAGSAQARQVTVPEADELADLALALNRMASELGERIDQVADERDRAGQILAALESGVLLLDTEGGLRYANPAGRAWLGLGDFTPGEPARRILGVPEVMRLVDEATASGRSGRTEIALVFPERRTLSVRATPLTERGGSAGVVVTMVDLTSRRRVEVLRRDFVANASHELKTPVAAIRVLAEGLDSAIDDDPDRARDFLARIGTEAERLERLVADLLDLSRVERGTLAVEPVDMVGLVKDVAGRYVARAVQHGIELSTDLQPDVVMRGDRAQLELLVSNLVDNALRYTEPGGTVCLRLSAAGEQVRIQVADTGQGIPSGELPRVFERFYRIDKARDRQSGGTGLGLAIVRHVAESHGGEVVVESELRRGSTFTATLPANPPQQAKPTSQA